MSIRFLNMVLRRVFGLQKSERVKEKNYIMLFPYKIVVKDNLITNRTEEMTIFVPDKLSDEELSDLSMKKYNEVIDYVQSVYGGNVMSGWID